MTTRWSWSKGCVAHRERIDEILADYAEGWTVDRMPGVDRAVLRIGIYELLWRDDVPDPVAIDEAVELAKTLSTDESPDSSTACLPACVRDPAHHNSRRASQSTRSASVGLGLAVEDQRVRREHLPAHELLGESLDRGVVHDGERAQVVGADRQHRCRSRRAGAGSPRRSERAGRRPRSGSVCSRSRLSTILAGPGQWRPGGCSSGSSSPTGTP